LILVLIAFVFCGCYGYYGCDPCGLVVFVFVVVVVVVVVAVVVVVIVVEVVIDPDVAAVLVSKVEFYL